MHNIKSHRLSDETVRDVLNLLYDDGKGHPSGPGDLLKDSSPRSDDRQFLASAITRVDRRFNTIASQMLWDSICVSSVSQLEALARTANQKRHLPAMTRRLYITVGEPVSLIAIHLLLQFMTNLEVFVYEILQFPEMSWHYCRNPDHSDVWIGVLSRFSRGLKTAVFSTQKAKSPSARGILMLMTKLERLEVLHFDDISRNVMDDHVPAKVPPHFQARALHTLSFGNPADRVDSPLHMDEAGFIMGGYPTCAFPALQDLRCQSFSPRLYRFVRRISWNIRKLEITPHNKFFYHHPTRLTGFSILEALKNLQHLTWRIGYGIPQTGWKPLPGHHATLQRITILPDSPLAARDSRSGISETLRAILDAIPEAGLPSLRTVEVEISIGRRGNVAGAEWFLELLQRLQHRVEGGGLDVAWLDAGVLTRDVRYSL